MKSVCNHSVLLLSVFLFSKALLTSWKEEYMSTGSGDVTNEVQESSKTLSCGTTRQQVQASWKDE